MGQKMATRNAAICLNKSKGFDFGFLIRVMAGIPLGVRDVIRGDGF
jgi:hypothetical protein